MMALTITLGLLVPIAWASGYIFGTLNTLRRVNEDLQKRVGRMKR